MYLIPLDIERWRSTAALKFSNYAAQSFNQRLYSMKPTSECKMHESFLYMYALSLWDPNSDTNHITEDEVREIVSRIQEM